MIALKRKKAGFGFWTDGEQLECFGQLLAMQQLVDRSVLEAPSPVSRMSPTAFEYEVGQRLSLSRALIFLA